MPQKTLGQYLTDFAAQATGHAATYLLLTSLAPFASAYLLRESGVVLPIWGLVALFGIPIAALGATAWFVRRQKVQVLDSFSVAEFEEATRSATEIRVLNTFVPNFADIRESLQKALSVGVTVKVLMLRPDCQEVDYRASTLGISAADLSQNIEDACDYLAETLDAELKNKSLLELRFHTAWIPFSLYGSNKAAIVGYFFFGLLAVEGPSLLITRIHPQFEVFWTQFQKLWELSTPVRVAAWRSDLNNSHRRENHVS